jgi:hypothetical protein
VACVSGAEEVEGDFEGRALGSEDGVAEATQPTAKDVMTPEQLEIAITHYLDGTLPAEEVGALRETLANDPAARALLAEHERLTALLRSVAGPEVEWGELARDFCAVVTGSVDEASRASDQKLNAVLKGAAPLPAIRWEALSRRIYAAVDAEVGASDAQDERLDAMLRSAPVPAVNWDRLAGHLSRVVAAEAGVEERPAVIGRIGWARTASRWAVAACLLVAAGLGIRAYVHRGATGGTGPGHDQIAVNPTKGTLLVETPTVEVASRPAVAEVSIGPSAQYAVDSDEGLYRRGVAARSPVVIATPVSSNEDAERGLMFE